MMKQKKSKSLQKTYTDAPKIVRYFFISCLALAVDVVLVWLFYRVLALSIVLSNTIGVVCGFIVSYGLTARFVFLHAKGKRGFSIFFSTFIIGLILADVLIYVGEHFIFEKYHENVSFFLSKGLSIAVPFFLLYFLRKYFYTYRAESTVKKE